MALFLIGNYPMQTTAAAAVVTTGTVIKTMLQVKSTTSPLKVVEWGYSFSGSSAASPGNVELIETDVAATVTASVANDICRFDAAALLISDPTTNIISVGTSATGYTATAEGSITSVRNLDAPNLSAPTTQFIKQFPLGREPILQINKFLRVRVTFAAAINMYCYVIVES
jgi:hypothetical protein